MMNRKPSILVCCDIKIYYKTVILNLNFNCWNLHFNIFNCFWPNLHCYCYFVKIIFLFKIRRIHLFQIFRAMELRDTKFWGWMTCSLKMTHGKVQNEITYKASSLKAKLKDWFPCCIYRMGKYLSLSILNDTETEVPVAQW